MAFRSRLGGTAAALLCLASSCAAPIPAPEHELHQSALAGVVANPTVYLAPPEIFSTRYRQHEGVLQMIAKATQLCLEEGGFRVLSATRFQEAWTKSEARVGGLYDAQSGELDHARMDRCYALTVQRLAEERSFAGVVIPAVTYGTLDLKKPYRKGAFGGVMRKVQFDGGVPNSVWLQVMTMTLRPKLVTVSGEIAYEGAGGLDFGQKSVFNGAEIRQVPKERGDFDYADIQEGVAIALRPLVDAIRSGSGLGL